VRSSQGKESTRIRLEERLGAVPGAMAGFVAMSSPREAGNVRMTPRESSRRLEPTLAGRQASESSPLYSRVVGNPNVFFEPVGARLNIRN
jgi:hypothetical protein